MTVENVTQYGKRVGRPWQHPKTGITRYYLTPDQVLAFEGWEIHYYKTGNVSIATLRGRRTSNSAAKRATMAYDSPWVAEDDSTSADLTHLLGTTRYVPVVDDGE